MKNQKLLFLAIALTSLVVITAVFGVFTPSELVRERPEVKTTEVVKVVKPVDVIRTVKEQHSSYLGESITFRVHIIDNITLEPTDSWNRNYVVLFFPERVEVQLGDELWRYYYEDINESDPDIIAVKKKWEKKLGTSDFDFHHSHDNNIYTQFIFRRGEKSSPFYYVEYDARNGNTLSYLYELY